jgi:magnesium chelatase family protein
MFANVKSIALLGVEGRVIEVQVDINRGLFEFNIVGMASKSIIESKKRIISAIKNAGFEMPMGRVVVNLAPADMIKSSTAFDLPIATAILLASNQIAEPPQGRVFWGELSLNAQLTNTKGTLAAVLAAVNIPGIKEFVLPAINAKEAGNISQVKLLPISGLRELTASIEGINAGNLGDEVWETKRELAHTWIIDHPKLIRAIIIAAVGRHNLLLVGPPGVGKSFIAQVLEQILPELNLSEALDVSRIYSLAGMLNNRLLRYRPLRAPHHSITKAAFIGGGTIFKPGEVSLAHNGVLFLDEFNMFASDLIETLRQPLENKTLNISRGNYSLVLPADFCLLAAMNPCKCGNYGSRDSECRCTEGERQQYWKRISRPILDRIDMQVYVPNNITTVIKNASSIKVVDVVEIKSQVSKALGFRSQRLKEKIIPTHGDSIHAKLHSFDTEASALLINVVQSMNISIRGYNKLLELARTIADIECKSKVEKHHVVEAVDLRLVGFEH